MSRSIGFWGLTFVSLGSIIGSGWLLGALGAATVAGPASMISWILAAIIILSLALVHAELASAYPVAGGTARFPYFAFGTLAGFTAGWAAWLQAVAVAPIEVEASLSYLNSVSFIHDNFNMLKSDGSGSLNGLGLIVAVVFMALFTVLNLMGAKMLSESNSVMVIWKVAVPILTVIVLMSVTFHSSNFTAGGGFAPNGAHGIFAALPLGVVFAIQGFEQAVQMGGEAKNPQRDLPRAIMTAMAVGAGVYILLEIAFIGALNPANLVRGWQNPIGIADYGPYYTLALGAGVGWLATILIIDAFVSPAGTGLVYVGTTARLSYALGQEEVLPNQLTQTNKKKVPVYSILLAFVVGLFFFLPFPSWGKLVGIITSATAIMYAFAPVSLAALHKSDPDRPRGYRVRLPQFMCPAAFCAANLIIYWSGFDVMWKLLAMIFVGRVLFEFALRRASADRTDIDWKATSWIWPWLVGMTLITVLGRYGHGHDVLPDWVDLAVVVLFSLAIFYYAVEFRMSNAQVQRALATEDWQLPDTAEVTIAEPS
ncbi:MAG TPA: APC family permease [Jatrophihabitantaceae bacterium]